MKIGTVVKNHYAGKNNPTKYFIYLGISGKYADVIDIHCDGKLHKGRYYKESLKDKTKYEEVGYCNFLDIAKQTLIEHLNKDIEM